MTENNGTLLSIQHLSTHFFTEQGLVRAVQDVSFDLVAGKTLAVVGESGCGKSVTALSVMRLIPYPPGKIVEGDILLNGRSLLKLTEYRMRQIRGNEIAMIFQEPMTSLNPVFTVGSQIVEVILLHRKIGARKARELAIEMMRKVGIADPQQRIDEYPHQMSGGMRQRVMIAMALSCSPKVLIADEPTTALDVTIQAQILVLLRQLQGDNGMSIMLITHDLGVVAENADDVVVMYASKVVETASVKPLFEKPLHPYTKA
jgi:ABC-type dipeptide/oligopeptide/nickel transport system ATPase component